MQEDCSIHLLHWNYTPYSASPPPPHVCLVWQANVVSTPPLDKDTQSGLSVVESGWDCASLRIDCTHTLTPGSPQGAWQLFQDTLSRQQQGTSSQCNVTVSMDGTAFLVHHQDSILLHKRIPHDHDRPTLLGALSTAYQRRLCTLAGNVTLHALESPHPQLQWILTVRVYLTHAALLQSQADALDSQKRNQCVELIHLFSFLHPNHSSDSQYLTVPKGDIQNAPIVPSVYPIPDTPHLQPSTLVPTLLPFQKRAVGWMLAREHVTLDAHGCVVPRTIRDPPLLTYTVPTEHGHTLFVHRLTGAVSLDQPFMLENEQQVLGGILADEMGLGKTVMVLALILLHERARALADRVSSSDMQGVKEQARNRTIIDGGNRRNGKTSKNGQIVPDTNDHDYCTWCKAPPSDKIEFWIACDECDKWYHGRCVGLTQKRARRLDRYVCPSCEEAMERDQISNPIPTSGTLIIAPSVIIEQWMSETHRHAPSLTCLVYEADPAKPITPTELSRYDIVLTSYDSLRREVHAAKPEPGRSRRYAKKYKRRLSPLVRLIWWRVVLDEAQMVKTSVSQAAEMARLLTCIHPWAVTGTPMGKNGTSDLYGLVKFLNIQPLSSYPHMWWQLQNHPLFHATLERFMHRNLKSLVKSELTIPPQTERIVRLEFSRVERAWYDQLVERMMEEVRAPGFGTGKRAEEMRQTRLTGWLLQLRQACCHPQVGTQNRRALGGTLRTIGQVLEHMLKQAVSNLLTCERQLYVTRIYRAQLHEFIAKQSGWEKGADTSLEIYHSVLGNVQHTINSIQQELAAVDARRKELGYTTHDADDGFDLPDEDSPSLTGSSDLHDDLIDEQSTLTSRLHLWQELEHRILYFIASVYHSIKDEPREAEYYKRAEQIRRCILGPVEQDVRVMTARLERFVSNTWGKLEEGGGMVVGTVPISGICTADVMERVQEIVRRLDGQWGVMRGWRDWIRGAVTAPLEDASDGSTEQGQPSQRIDPPTGDEYQKGIDLQSTADVYQNWYTVALEDRRQLLTGHRTMGGMRGRESQNPQEKALRSELDPFLLPASCVSLKDLVNELRRMRQRIVSEVEVQLVQEAHNIVSNVYDDQVAKLGILQKESTAFAKLFNLRITYYRQLQKISDGVIPPPEPPSIQASLHQTITEEADLTSQITQLAGRKRYLEHLQRDTGEQECAICKMGVREGVLTPCGHIYCAECVRGWIHRHRKCPMCNQPVMPGTTTPVSLQPLPPTSSTTTTTDTLSDTTDEATTTLLSHLSNIPLKGSFGTKLDTLIRHLKHLSTPSLVFSQWDQVLDILAQGLTRNNISYVILGKSPNAIQRFRETNVQVLLLNARSQSAGLSLTCAAHVFLVEPVVYPELEAQAINRIHRIGQTRPTTVWRYLMQGTLEERVYGLRYRPRGACKVRKAGEVVHMEDVGWCLFGENTVVSEETGSEQQGQVQVETGESDDDMPIQWDEDAQALLSALRHQVENGTLETVQSRRGRGRAGVRRGPSSGLWL
ncbi:uncharacterized protein SPPG_01618 [Spizellomyces punctatus DAOM BR117]|uniref:RING-type domain-containing protein n=1 Tax=Spizellomyces punctatus (strain DAOM BR117) TaxID=645134 RepID=A0A0L0HTJ3_SPIPD|nr:uncharacterized protein SPPG_01618 [Spizellomyces punctatus DAOM BR117]KND04184.1 hypothetical protein SPPG_01618 [Spizellomyces punctatus DAOM BR117]|eukprot:XP_016612223.1 hypothetical protein SPPG_01618 [Spizellomyces punctatus DAOM BR117]